MRQVALYFWITASAMGASTISAHAAIIDDPSFFDNIPHTFVDFETRDDGSPLPLEKGQFAFAPLDEYAKLGFAAFRMNIAWEWSADPDVQQALTEGATPTKLLRMLPNSPSRSYGFFFAEDQRSVGMFVTRETMFSSEPMTITMVDRQGDVIEILTVSDDLIDGSAGSIEYGYVGASSSDGIAGVIFSADNIFAYGIDDFRFSQIPTPGAIAPLVLLGLHHQRRRR